MTTYKIVSTPAPADSPLAGHSVLAFDWGKARAYVLAQKARGVTYGLGCKIDTETSALTDPYPHFIGEDGRQCLKVDCSGIQRGVFAASTPGHITLPDGSAIQQEWASAQGFKATDYAMCENADNHVRLCFCVANEHEPIGHVWVVRNRVTLESHGGCGPDSRPWDTPVLRRIVTNCYVIT